MLTPTQINALKADLLQRLTAATTTPMTNGVLEFSQFLTANENDPKLKSAVVNAKVLLEMVWGLSQVSQFITDTVAANVSQGEVLYAAFAETVGQVPGFTRQPWATGDHAQYVADRNAFLNIYQTTLDVLNQHFHTMTVDVRRKMLYSTQGWNSEKGPPQLANDLFAQLYTHDVDPLSTTTRVAKTLPKDQIIGHFITGPHSDAVTTLQLGMTVEDTSGEWQVQQINGNNVTLNPI